VGAGICGSSSNYHIDEPPASSGARPFGVAKKKLGDASIGIRSWANPCFGIFGGKVLGDVFYLGLDGLIDFWKSKSKYDRDYKVKDGGGTDISVSARVGYILSAPKTMLYAKLGVSFPKDAHVYRTTDILDLNFNPKQGEYELDVKKSKNAFLVGAGIEKYVSENVSLRLEGERVFKKSFKVSSGLEYTGLYWSAKGRASKYNVRVICFYSIPLKEFK
jgi:opacity protein-like surface antigen